MCLTSQNVSTCMVVLLTILTIGNEVYGAVFTQKAFNHPGNYWFLLINSSRNTYVSFTILAFPGKCFNPLTKKAMIPEKQYKMKGICAAMSCDIDNLSISIETCPIVDMPGCEEIPSDPSWSYPKCCPRFRCEDFKTGELVIFDATSF